MTKTTLVLIVAGTEVGEMDVEVFDGTKVHGDKLPAMLLVNLSADQARKLSDTLESGALGSLVHNLFGH